MEVRSKAAEMVKMHLTTHLGEHNVLGVKRIEGGYEVLVPFYSAREYLAWAGINNAHTLWRDTFNDSGLEGVHTLVVPDSCLPAKLARDAAFFNFLDKAGITKGVRDIYRTTDGNDTTGYVLEVDKYYSRDSLEAVGIKKDTVGRDMPDRGPDHIIIPMSVATRVLEQAQKQAATGTVGNSWVEDTSRQPPAVRTHGR